MSEFAWQPRPEDLETSNLARILRRHDWDYERYLRWSIEDPEGFWREVDADLGLVWSQPYERVLDLSGGKPWAKWFVGGRLNVVESAVDRHAQERPDALALVWEGEEGAVRTYTYRELLAEVEAVAAGLLAQGFEPGDRVGIHLPMIPEVAIALLAVVRLGGIVVPLFSGFGADAIAVRLAASGARWLFTTDGALRRGKPVGMLATARQARADAPTVERTIVVGRLTETPALEPGELAYAELRREGAQAAAVVGDPDQVLMLIYTSGTTGKPKGTRHVHGGFPIKAAQDMLHLFDVRPSDRIFWLTDIGWMMGPWLIFGGLILGATVVLYDGAPDQPEPDRLWALWARHKVTIGGIAPTLIRALMPKGAELVRRHDLSRLRIMGSTGEPWNEEPWRWTLEHVGGGRVPIVNYSGGTEISGGILGCVVLRPLKPMSFNTVVPGVDADAVDEEGRPVRGDVGYLIVRNVNPGMTRGFWEEPERYLETYWSRYPDVWYHGDLVRIDADGHWYIIGRADDTIKVAGKRLGPAEMETVAVEHPAVQEAAVIGVPDELKGQVPVLFVVPVPGVEPSAELCAEIRAHVAERMGKALGPKAVHVLSDLPKTRNAKVMRRVLKAVYLGEEPGNLTALVNPEILDEIRALREA